MTLPPRRPMDEALLVATGNPGKVREIRRLLADAVFDVALPAEEGISWESPEEVGATYDENALLKAASLGVKTGRPTIGEDAGLEVEALDGAPGLHSARYAPTNAERVSKLLAALGDAENRRAAFVCTLALWWPSRTPMFFRGRLEGAIAEAPRGDGGFGYDPIFVPDGHSQTLAELAGEAKDRLSHRGQALRELVAWYGFEVLSYSGERASS